MSVSGVLRGLFAAGLLAGLSLPVFAQSDRELDLIGELAEEQVAQREAEAAAAREAAHQAMLEEQSRLKAAYQEYLGEARRTAQAMIEKKRKAATQEQVDKLRQRALAIISEVDDGSKQRVPNELDPVYAELEELLALTNDELLKANPDLAQARRKLGGDKLGWVDRTAILYALCESDRHAEVIAGNVQFREKLTGDESASIDETNRRRLILGLQPTAVDFKLVECSRDHSKDMVEHGFFSHTSPIEGKESPWQRAKNFGTSASGENIAAGYANGHAVTMGWWYSPGHLKNMMGGGHRRIAVGQHNQHYTQMFGG